MKEFEKWLERRWGDSAWSRSEVANAAWRAALQWALSWENNIEPRWREEYLPERDTLPIYDIIKKELEDDVVPLEEQ